MGETKNTVIATGRAYTPWGIAVKKSLLISKRKQDDIVAELNELGYRINKKAFSDLLFGIGVTAESKIPVIEAVNAMLGIEAV